jgi:hypothetical protein
MATVSVSLTIPGNGAQTSARRPQYVPTNTTSISLDFGTGPQNFNTEPGSPGCTSAGTSSSTEYTTSSQPRGITRGPDGNIWYAMDIGESVGSITPAGVKTETNIGLPFYSDSFLPASVTVGTPASVAVNVTATDPSGNVIVGSDSYADASGNPLTIALTNSVSSGATLSTTSVTSPSTLVTLTYDGSGLPSVTITPTITGGSAAGTVTAGTLTVTVP